MNLNKIILSLTAIPLIGVMIIYFIDSNPEKGAVFISPLFIIPVIVFILGIFTVMIRFLLLEVKTGTSAMPTKRSKLARTALVLMAILAGLLIVFWCIAYLHELVFESNFKN